MKQKLVNAFNEQIQNEFASAFLYLEFSAALASYGYKGASYWMRQQYTEECSHALKLMSFLEERGESPIVPEIKKYGYEWQNIKDIFELSLKHEKKVTELINDLLALAIEVRDFPAQNLLYAFVDEQVEEESTLNDILDQFKICGYTGEGMLVIDKELATRPEASLIMGGKA